MGRTTAGRSARQDASNPCMKSQTHMKHKNFRLCRKVLRCLVHRSASLVMTDHDQQAPRDRACRAVRSGARETADDGTRAFFSKGGLKDCTSKSRGRGSNRVTRWRPPGYTRMYLTVMRPEMKIKSPIAMHTSDICPYHPIPLVGRCPDNPWHRGIQLHRMVPVAAACTYRHMCSPSCLHTLVPSKS
jgi:hypothetical protein